MWQRIFAWIKRRQQGAAQLVEERLFDRERDLRIAERRLEILSRQADTIKESIKHARPH